MSLKKAAWAGVCAMGLAAGAAAAADLLKFDFSPSPIEHLLKSVEENRKTVVAPRCAKAPEISGKMDEKAWAQAGAVEGFAGGRARVCYDADNLYMAIECKGKTPAPAAEPERDAPPLWKEDHIEIWFAPPSLGGKVCQFALSGSGHFYDGVNTGGGGDASHDPVWSLAVGQNPTGWTATIAIPRKALLIEQWPAEMGFSIGRNGGGGPTRSWTASYGAADQGRLVLEGVVEPPAARAAQAAGEPLSLTFDPPLVRCGGRWAEGRIRVSSEAVKAGAKLAATLFACGDDKPLARVEAPAPREAGALWADLRTPQLARARVRVELMDAGRRVSVVEAFLSSEQARQTLAPGQRIPVRLDAPEGAQVKDWPVVLGVPFPEGALWDVNAVRLVDGQGREVPCQREAAALWAREGSIKWLRFDALATPGQALFVEAARPGAGASPATPVRVTGKGDTLELDTGAARYVLARGASPIAEVWAGGRRVAQAQGARGLYLVDQQGRLAKASADEEKMEVEANGPVAACVRFEGDYKTAEGERMARHVTRVEASAGQPFARVTHTLILTEDTNKVWFREAGWEFAVAPGAQAQAVFGVSRDEPLKTQAVPLDKTSSAWMIQDQHYRHGHGKNHFQVARREAGGKDAVVAEGEECGDFAALAGADGGLALACREAARQHPKEFEARPGFLTLKLFSNRAGEELDFRAEALVKRWDLAGWYEKTLGQANKKTNPLEKVSKFTSNAAGWGKTHELLVAPVTAAAPREAAQWAWLLSRPVQAMADPAWICASGAMYRVHPRDRERFPLAEKLIDETFGVWEKRIGDWGDYGFVDYFAGPHLGYKGNYVNPFRYGRFTYSLRADLWLLYARSGERRMRDMAEGTNRAYMDNFFAHYDVGSKVTGLCVSGAGDSYDAKGGLPFYWEGISAFNLSSSSNLDQFLWLYYFTGFRHAKDRVEDYGRGALKAWSPQRAKRDWRILATTRLLTQVYTFTWDPAIRALIEANTDLFTDADSALGLTKDRPYNSSSYKTQVDVACILDAWRALGHKRYYDLSLNLSRFWWGNYLATFPIFYFNPQGRIGQFLHDETGDPSIPQHLLLQLRQACTAFDPKTGAVTGSESGNIGAHDAAFVMHGIPFAQEVIVRTNADREPLASWVGFDDFGFSASVVSRKGREGALALDARYSSEGGSGSASLGDSGGFAIRPLIEDRAWGMDLNTVEERSGGVVRARVPKDAPAGEYEFVTPTHGFQFFQARERIPLVLHAPQYWKPMPDVAPATRWYFRLPRDAADSQLFFEGSARLFDPAGKPWPEDKEVSGWVDLPQGKPGLWSFEPVRNRLVGSRNLPPFFAANDPGSHFEPRIAWRRQPAFQPAPPLPPDQAFIDGAIGLPDNKALSLTARKAFRLNAGAAHATDGGLYLPFRQGTIEFFIKPAWSSFDLPEERSLTLVRLLTGKEDWTLNCNKYPDSKVWYMTHSLYAYFMTDGPSRNISMRAYRQMVFMPGEWVHVAWVWGSKEVNDFRSGKTMRCASTRLFVNGKQGRFFAYSGGQWRGNDPAYPATAMLLLNIAPAQGTAYDELRVSDIQRYTNDFAPPSRDRELALDEHTRALFHFNGDLAGKSWDAKEEIKGEMTTR